MGRFDRTEVDLRLTDVLVEAKLTESDFQSAEKGVLWAYRDFSDVFDWEQLLQTDNRYRSYQLLRNVLAACALQCSFCVLVDARRPDLADAWYAVMKCVKPVELRTKLRISTWQEAAEAGPPKLRAFLAVKYGINSQELLIVQRSHLARSEAPWCDDFNGGEVQSLPPVRIFTILTGQGDPESWAHTAADLPQTGHF